MSKEITGQVCIEITGTEEFEVRGYVQDRREGTITPIHGGRAQSLQKAWMIAVEVASGIVVGIGQLEQQEARGQLRLVSAGGGNLDG